VSRNAWIVAALAVAGVAVVLGRVLAADSEGRALEFAPDMVRTPALGSYASSPVLPGGAGMLPLVEGVVVRGTEAFEYGGTPEEAVRAGRELTNPFAPGDAPARARGARVYAVACAVCHGADGETRPPAVLRGVVAPPSLLAARAVAMKDGQIFHVVTKGQGKMPPYAAMIDPDDRWKAILHVRALQGGAAK
jgi:mono/diheme cytochrome c family protein